MTTRSKNSIDKLGRCSTTGQVARRCRCIHHDEWLKDNPDFNLINLVKDKSKNLSKSIEKKVREKNILSGKFICTGCIRVVNVTTMCKQHEKISSSEESDNNENMDTTNIVEINQEVQRLAMKILQLNKINKAKVNLKPIADALPLGVVSDMLIYKTEKNKEENDENINIECMQFINYLGDILSDKVYEDAKNINGKVTPGVSYYTVHNWMSKRAENRLFVLKVSLGIQKVFCIMKLHEGL